MCTLYRMYSIEYVYIGTDILRMYSILQISLHYYCISNTTYYCKLYELNINVQ